MDEPKVGYDSSGRKKFWRRTTENQLTIRGSRIAGSYLVARGGSMINKPDHTVTYTRYQPRYNKHGTVIVGAHTQRTIQFTTSDGGRDFQHSDRRAKARKVARGSHVVRFGRVIPVLGYGYAIHNTLNGGQVMREGEGHPIGAAAWATHDIKESGVRNTIQSLRDSINPVVQYNKMKEMKPFWKK